MVLEYLGPPDGTMNTKRWSHRWAGPVLAGRTWLGHS
jgi:hypothetical protein